MKFSFSICASGAKTGIIEVKGWFSGLVQHISVSAQDIKILNMIRIH